MVPLTTQPPPFHAPESKANRWQNAKRLLENRGQASGRGFLCRKVFGFVPKDGGAKEMGSMS